MSHPVLDTIPEKIFRNAVDALSEANYKCTYGPGPGSDIWHYDYYCVLDAAHAGELFMKALIAEAHPLLIFKNIFDFKYANDSLDQLSIENIIKNGITHDFQHLPKILWATRGIKIKDQTSFDFIRKARNSIQHFITPEGENSDALRKKSLKFLHEEIGWMAWQFFNIRTIDYFPNVDDGDYLIFALIKHEVKFKFPEIMEIDEVDIHAELSNCNEEYQAWFKKEIRNSKSGINYE